MLAHRRQLIHAINPILKVINNRNLQIFSTTEKIKLLTLLLLFIFLFISFDVSAATQGALFVTDGRDLS